MRIEQRLQELGIELPAAPSPIGNYVDAVQVGNLLFTSGKGSRTPAGKLITGKVGRDVTTEEAYQHARAIGLFLIAVWKAALGDLDRVKRVVKVLGLVNATPEFGEQPKVINGCSDLFVEIFGDRGRRRSPSARAGSLPNNITVEIEVIVEVGD